MPRLVDVDEIKKREKDVVLANGAKHRCFDTTMLYEIPTVDAEPVRHGHWVHGKELSRDYIGDVCVGIHYDKCWCSECNYTVYDYPLLWKYCPICGAMMDEVEE